VKVTLDINVLLDVFQNGRKHGGSRSRILRTRWWRPWPRQQRPLPAAEPPLAQLREKIGVSCVAAVRQTTDVLRCSAAALDFVALLPRVLGLGSVPRLRLPVKRRRGSAADLEAAFLAVRPVFGPVSFVAFGEDRIAGEVAKRLQCACFSTALRGTSPRTVLEKLRSTARTLHTPRAVGDVGRDCPSECSADFPRTHDGLDARSTLAAADPSNAVWQRDLWASCSRMAIRV
jgi:hypothetical protein